jgi:uncharacterized membrane-anchored protein
MDEKLTQQLFEELLPSLEALDTKCAAILQFLKRKGIASEDEIAPYLEQAGNASSVRWRAARVRINHLLSTPKSEEKTAGTPSAKASETISEPAGNTSPAIAQEKTDEDAQDARNPADNKKTVEDVAANTEKSQDKQGQKNSQSSEHAEKDAA